MSNLRRAKCRINVLAGAVLFYGTATAGAATITVGPWSPLFQGIELATSRQQAVFAGERNQAVYGLRVDLSDPTVRFFGLPRCSNWHAWRTNEVISITPSRFLADHGLQVAVNCNFFWPNSMAPGVPTDVYGLAISQGQIVSATNDPAHPSALLFTTNNQPTFIATNIPSTNLTGIYTAVSGNLPLVLQGLNVAPTANPQNPDVDPRTALGISQDRRFLIAVVIDGRQAGYSDGATYYETADWLIRYGAYHGMNVDGGSCSSLVMQNCVGQPVLLNKNSYVESIGHGQERGVGHIIGFYATPAPSFIHDVQVLPSSTTATILWKTAEAATTQLEYGLTTNYGSFSTLSELAARDHVMTLTGLTTNQTYFFRALSCAGGNTYSWACQFTTTDSVTTELIFGLTQAWKYTTNNLDRTNWPALDYDDSAWLGPAPGLLAVETNSNVAPRNTLLPPPFGSLIPPCYYFRTHFGFSGDPSQATLMFSNYVDDGAVFYLNGAEIYRLRMRPAPATITYTNLATGYACSNSPCSGDACANCPDVFTIPAKLMTNLYEGDNLLAVAVHNYAGGSLDVVFGSALYWLRPCTPPAVLNLLHSAGHITFYWNDTGLTLQQTDQLASPADWIDTPGPVTLSPYTIINPGSTRFFRLRR